MHYKLQTQRSNEIRQSAEQPSLNDRIEKESKETTLDDSNDGLVQLDCSVNLAATEASQKQERKTGKLKF